jgi:hypothetical protein
MSFPLGLIDSRELRWIEGNFTGIEEILGISILKEFRMKEFAFGRQVKPKLCASLQTFLRAEFHDTILREVATLCTWEYFPESKFWKREANHSPSSSAEAMNARSVHAQGQLLSEVFFSSGSSSPFRAQAPYSVP